ncbi:RNA polymerase beta subunit, chloroplastic [Tanacetum coccineum]
MWPELTPLGLVKEKSMLELYRCRTLTCYECGNPRHYRSDCLELKNQNYENQAEGTGARRMVHALGGGETN